MKAFKITCILLLGFILIGCGNLKEIRYFAEESAKISAYTELTTHFRDTYAREQPYLYGKADRLAQENDIKRKTAYADLMRIHQTVYLYMQTLAILAGNEPFELSEKLDAISSNINAHPNFGLQKKHTTSASKITKTLTKWITSRYQKNALRTMIMESDTPLQITLEGMSSLLRYYRKTHENEKKTILGFFEYETLLTNTSEDKLLVTLARVHMQSKQSEFMNIEQKLDAVETGIQNIAEGHKKLFENLEKLSSDEVKAKIRIITDDIKNIRTSLSTIQS